jgi:hypothetical protein
LCCWFICAQPPRGTRDIDAYRHHHRARSSNRFLFFQFQTNNNDSAITPIERHAYPKRLKDRQDELELQLAELNFSKPTRLTRVVAADCPRIDSCLVKVDYIPPENNQDEFKSGCLLTQNAKPTRQMSDDNHFYSDPSKDLNFKSCFDQYV